MAIRLGMFALTMAVIVWIGWSVPQPQESVADPLVAPQPQTPMTVQPQSVTAAKATGMSSRLSGGVVTPERPRTAKVLDLNRATEQDLEALPGIGPVLAERIVTHRQKAGPFASVEDLRAVKGIGKKTFEKLRTFVNVSPASKPPREGKKAA